MIVGGESGLNFREMNLDHARASAQQADRAGIAVFVKQDSGPSGQQSRISTSGARRSGRTLAQGDR
jgi:protein gp37